MPEVPQPPGPALSRLEQVLLKALLEHLPDHIYFKDRTSRFLCVNAALARWAGFADSPAMVGRSDFDLFAPEHARAAFADEQMIIATEQPILDSIEKETWPDGRVTWVATTKLPLRDLDGTVIGTFGVSRDVTTRRRAEEQLRLLTRAVSQCPVAIVITDAHGAIEYANPWFEKVTGYTLAEFRRENPRILQSGEHPRAFYEQLWHTLSSGTEWTGELHNRRKDGTLFWERTTISPVRAEDGTITHYIAVGEDITERRRAEHERQELQSQLDHARKQESIGRLSAGIAHEINTPGQFVADNLRFLALSFQHLSRYFAAVDDLRAHAATLPQLQAPLAELAEIATEIELDFLRTEIPTCFTQSLDGMARIARIVGALKDFAHPVEAGRTPASLARLIETAVTVSRHEWKYVADLTTDFDPRQPEVPVVIDQFNQVILSLIINAAHAVGGALAQRGESKGRIVIRTRTTAAQAIVEVEDNGTGIAEAVQPHLFEPFVSTKGAATAAGQGLHVAQRIALHHGGRLEFCTETGHGTTFRLFLPLQPAAPPAPSS